MLHLTCAIANRLAVNADSIQHREIEVGHRGAFGVDDVAAGLEGAVAVTGKDDGQVCVDVLVAIAQAAAIDDERVIQQ